MKKILLLLTLISFGCVAQNNPAQWRNGIETKFIALDTLTTAQRDAITLKASKGYVIFNADTNVLNLHNGSSWGVVGSGTLANIVEDTTPQLGGNLDINGFAIRLNETTDIDLYSDFGNSFKISQGGVDKLSIDIGSSSNVILDSSTGIFDFLTDIESTNFIKTGGTSNDILLGDGTTYLLSKKITGDTLGLENASLKPITRAVLHDYSIDPTSPTLAAGDISFTINSPLAISFTGTVIPLDDYYQHDDSATDTATWTLAASPKNGALVEIKIEMASEPTITGATQFSNSPAFIAATPMILTVKHILGTTYYFFTEL